MYMNAKAKRTFPLHLHISTLVIMLVLAAGAAISYVSYTRTASMLDHATRDLFVRISHETSGEFDRLFAPVAMATNLLALQRVTRATSLEQRLDSLPYFRLALDNCPEVSQFAVGYGDGDFFLVRRLPTLRDHQLMSAPDNAAYMVQSIERSDGVARAEFVYYDEQLAIIRRDDRPDYATYDPRSREWYQKASAVDHLIRTVPYVFRSDGQLGTTLARRAATDRVVVIADIRLETLTNVLNGEKISKRMQLALLGPDAKPLAYEQINRVAVALPDGSVRRPKLEDIGDPALAELSRRLMPDGQLPANQGGAPSQTDLMVGQEKWLGALVELELRSDRSIYLAMALPENDLLLEARRMRRDALIGTFLVLLLSLPLAVWLARAIAKPLHRLAGDADAVRHFDFSGRSSGRSLIREVDNLSVAMDGMRQTIRQFLHINQAVAAEEDFDALMVKLLAETAAAGGESGGVLFLANAKGDRLTPVASLSPDGGKRLQDCDALQMDALPGLLALSIAEEQARAGELSKDEIVRLKNPGMDGALPGRWGMAVPLFNRKRQLVGALLLCSPEQPDPARLSFLSALAASSAVTLETRELMRDQKELFESFIRIIASAIDAKSPYTGGHCARVPELTKMLARAACDATEGPYADFSLTPDYWEAVHIAAWLHDCGKVTTPEYVVDKATKLETIYDRIHEVRMRFELLKRESESRYWQALAQGGSAAALRPNLESEWATLDEEFAFVAQCNHGGEFLSAENQQRLREIGKRSWTRTLDDRLGLSYEELKRREGQPVPALPVAEPLLSDRPEHRIPRPDNQRLAPDNPWGFRMQVPELLYDRGELHNLCISRGTLTDEERYKINEHIVQTLIMLSQLPFPKHLQDVPEIAGGHHEKMDGTGYPKRLTRGQMSPLARMMAIADIFEALTAVDRPYKQGKSLSEAIKIMGLMKRDRHIDPELFELFLRAGVYLEYARRYMPEELIDHVDVDAVLAG
jgi:HD-GYP domain-containing protein (c-di-GMP phosphodiesterase class II)